MLNIDGNDNVSFDNLTKKQRKKAMIIEKQIKASPNSIVVDELDFPQAVKERWVRVQMQSRAKGASG